MVRGFCVSVALLAFASPAFALPDLVVSELRVTPFSADVGAEIEIVTAITNLGDVAVRPPAPTFVSTSADMSIVRTQVTPGYEGAYLIGWGPTAEIPPGGTENYTTRVRVPPGGPANTGYVCADVDLANRVTESNEGNNRRCVNFHARAAKPNLVIRSITLGAVTGVSRAVRISVQNVGAAPAGSFRVDAYALAPTRSLLLVTNCALTVRGGSAPCASPFGELAPGASQTFDAYITFPADRPSGRREVVEFMVDGCFPPLEPSLPAYCRVDESNEADNKRRVRVVAP